MDMMNVPDVQDPQDIADELYNEQERSRLSRDPSTPYVSNGTSYRFDPIRHLIANRRQSNNDKATRGHRDRNYHTTLYPTPAKKTTKQEVQRKVLVAKKTFDLLQPTELQPAVIFVTWLRDKQADQLTCIKSKILSMLKPCEEGTDCARCEQCANCTESTFVNIRGTIESSAVATQLNQAVKGKFKNMTNLCCWLCGFNIAFGNCEIEHVYSSTVTAITSMGNFFGHSQNPQKLTEDEIRNIICNNGQNSILNGNNNNIIYNSLYPAHRLCNRGKAGDIFSNFIYDNSTKTFKLQPNETAITNFAKNYATYIYSDEHLSFIAQCGETSPVYLTVDMLRDNDKALIKRIKDTYVKNEFETILVSNITRIMNYSSDFPIKEEDLITNVTTLQFLETRYYKVNDNDDDMPREYIFTVDYLQSFKNLDVSLVKFAEKLETGKIITISRKTTRILQTSDMCTYKYFGNSNLVPYLKDDISELYGPNNIGAKGIRKNKPFKTKKNKKNKTRNKRNQKIKRNQNKGTKRT